MTTYSAFVYSPNLAPPDMMGRQHGQEVLRVAGVAGLRGKGSSMSCAKWGRAHAAPRAKGKFSSCLVCARISLYD